jgi:predicted AAA+ superfamily ATPase
MALSNRDRVGKALELLGRALGPYVDLRMSKRSPMGGNWKATYADVNVDEDPSAQISAVLDNWQAVFRDELRTTGRNLIGEVRDWRNKWAHNEPFSLDDAYRALDTIERLLTVIGAADAATGVGAAKSELMRQRLDAEAKKATPKPNALFTEPSGGLRPWRDVIQPHDDVAKGKFALAEFAANLYQVHLGRGLAEYTEPVEFFRRTYLTAGLRQLLTQAAQRITCGTGVPVVDLQTNFGGGKTHSMIALYHLFSGLPVTRFPQEIQDLLASASVREMPSVRRAVLVGTEMSPGQPEVKPDGTEIRTLWGEIAWQLGGLEGYRLVAEADRTATNPGQAMSEVFRRFGPCLVLVDEWVAYARQLFETSELLPGGMFETQFSFAQTLADAAIAVPGVLLVVSLPVSDDPARPGVAPIGSEVEVGGVAGQEAARRLGNVIGRTETSWRPASADESFEIVRRRLFEPVPSERVKYRDATAQTFSELYRTQAAEFPSECREPGYIDKIKRSYPIHPELFARLYEDWSTLEGFQRTRGVLRLMAAVISALWAGNDQSPLILPATVPLDDAAVQSELTRNLDHTWQPILDSDIDGPASVPHKVDRAFPNLGRYGAARRAARAVFLASAPRTGSANRGVEIQRVKLACTLPGESVATYGDALNRLTDRSSYLYVEGARYWYGTQASVARRARELVEQLLSTRRDEVHGEIVQRLRGHSRERGEFAAVHVCPVSAGEIPDDPEARLVILGPSAPHTNRDVGSLAMTTAHAILDQRASGQRLYRNMLVFLAPDLKRLEELERGAAEFLAWKEIEDRRAELNLDVFQTNQAESKRGDADRAVDLRLAETYHWCLVPDQPDPTGPVEWEMIKAEGQGSLGVRTSRRLVNAGSLGIAYASELLHGLLSTGGVLAPMWADGYTTVSALWDAFARYPYLPRLKSLDTLRATVRDGANPISWQTMGFALADAVDPKTGRFVALTTDGQQPTVTGATLVVRPDAAAPQLAEDTARTTAASSDASAPDGTSVPLRGGERAVLPDETLRRFYARAMLDPERYQRDFAKLAAEVIANLAGLLGTDVEISVEIKATNAEGFPDHVTRTVTENARTLKLDSYGFETD